MSKQVKHQAWYLAVASAIATILGALIEQNVLPAPWNGIAVGVGMVLGSLVSPPGAVPRLGAADTAALLTEIGRRGFVARPLTGPDYPPDVTEGISVLGERTRTRTTGEDS